MGQGDRGTIYAAYDFLRRFAGCRWVMPGEVGEIIPARTEVVVPETRINETPAFRFRIAAGFTSDPYVDWATKARLQIWSAQPSAWDSPEMVKRGGYVKGTMHHAFDALLPEERYFDEHPEYFGLLSGQRVAGPASQLCLSNPDVARIVAEGAVAYFDDHPEATFFSLCPNDNQNWCECEECAAFDTETMERWGRRYPVVADRYFQFVNQVADGLVASHPDKLLYTFAYQNYTWPPRAHLPRDNVIVSLCHMVPACYSHELTDPACEQNVEFDKILADWAAAHGNMWYYAYTCKSMWEQMPWPIARRLAQDIRHLHQSGFQGLYSQGSQGLWGQLGTNFHLMARMLWDPDTDVEATLDEYFALAFGPAAGPMKGFYDALEAGFSGDDVHVHHEADLWGPQILTPEVRERCRAALGRAQELAGGDGLVSARIAPVAAAYRHAVLRVQALAAERQWREAQDEAALRDAVEAYAQIVDLAESNPGGDALSMGSVKRYVMPRYDRLALPYDALLAPDGERQYSWQSVMRSAFEPERAEAATEWRWPDDQPDCGVSRAAEQGRESAGSLRLWSAVTDEASARMTALEHDWVIVSALSGPVDVQPGDAVVVTGWLRVPTDLLRTERGATLGIVGYDAAGKSPRGWTPGSIETRLLTATDGWQRLTVARSIDHPDIRRVAVRLALCGLGECHFDDVEVLWGTTR